MARDNCNILCNIIGKKPSLIINENHFPLFSDNVKIILVKSQNIKIFTLVILFEWCVL